MEFLLCGWLIFALIGAAIGSSKKASGDGFVLGLVLGPLGCILAFFMDHRTQCYACKGRIEDGARVCMHCRVPLAWYGSSVWSPEAVRQARARDAEREEQKAERREERSAAFSSGFQEVVARTHSATLAIGNVIQTMPGAVSRMIHKGVGEDNALVANFVVGLFWLGVALAVICLGGVIGYLANHA